MSEFATAPRPIRRVLVANRGEIACRVFRTCRRLGIGTVAVYSDADATALHVRSADAAIRVGPAPAAESYLRIEAIIAAALAGGVDAVHPGYGFLSENAAFARACEEAGLVFIGPSPAAISAMGSKIEAKKIAEAAGVPTVPGYYGADQSPDRLIAEAARIGYPVLIKASAGGGGRGMRRVDSEPEFADRLKAARDEARSAFGDEAVLLEKLVARPRHLEVQLFGDLDGNVVHLFERDCSVQRNHQKVFEEAPAPNLPEAVRDKLFDRALRLARKIGYSSAGTVEFVMEAGGEEPYFLEMNTRLQVEHPVTELITGIDLVEWQIRVAAGLPLPADQEQIVGRGHAIEARIAAERPELGYQPATGRIARVETPGDARFDTGIAEGSEIGVHYDSMVAKLVVHGATRAAAVEKLHAALGKVAILGVHTNVGMLRACVERPAFRDGTATTDFLGVEFPDGWRPEPGGAALRRAAAALAWISGRPEPDRSTWREASGFRVMGRRRPAQTDLVVLDGADATPVRILKRADGLEAWIDEAGPYAMPSGLVSEVMQDRVLVAHEGISEEFLVGLAIDRREETVSEAAADTRLVAPLPGVVTGLFANVGDPVRRGDNLVQMEAMKLVHVLKSPSDGTVGTVFHQLGQTVAAGATLVEIVPSEGE